MVLRVSVPEDVVSKELSGEMVLLNLATGEYFGLNEVGARMWSLLMKHGSPEPVLEALQAEFDVAPEVLRNDLMKLIADLSARGLVSTRE